MTLYTKSKTPVNNWDGDDLDLLGSTAKQFVNGLFDSKNCAAAVCIRNDGELIHMFAPVISDKVLEDDSVEKGALVLGNAVDDVTYLQPIKIDSIGLFGHTVAFMKKDEAHPVFKGHNVIPAEYLKDTVLEGETDIIAVYVPNAILFQFGSKIPYGNICDEAIQKCFSNQGGEYAAWAKVMKMMHENFDDFKTILESIKEKKQEKTYVSINFGAERGIVAQQNSPYLNISVVRDHSDHECIGNQLKKLFGPKTPAKVAPAATSSVTASALKSSLAGVFARPEDEEKVRKNEKSRNKLGIFFACPKSKLDLNKFTGDIEPVKPVFAEEFEEILDSKASIESRAEDLQAHVESAFADSPGFSDNMLQSSLSTNRSLVCFSLQSATMLLKAKLSTIPVTSIIKDSATLGPQSLLYQDNVENKADIAKDKENMHDAEAAQNIPENQRSNKKATIEVIGTMKSVKCVLGNLANILTFIISLCDMTNGNPMPILYTLYSIFYNFIASGEFQRWYLRHEKEHPYLHVYLWTVVQTIWNGIAHAATSAPNLNLVKKKRFDCISMDRFVAVADDLKSVLVEFKSNFTKDTHCIHIPRITPFELNPVAQEKKRIAEMIEGAGDSNKKAKTETDGNPNGGGGSNNANGKSKGKGKRSNGGGGAVRPATTDKKKLGFIVPDPEKPALVASTFLPRSLGLSKQYCFHFFCQGKECTKGDDCTFDHSTFPKMPEADRKKIMEYLIETKAAKMNPALLNNPRNQDCFKNLTEEQKNSLFASGASNE